MDNPYTPPDDKPIDSKDLKSAFPSKAIAFYCISFGLLILTVSKVFAGATVVLEDIFAFLIAFMLMPVLALVLFIISLLFRPKNKRATAFASLRIASIILVGVCLFLSFFFYMSYLLGTGSFEETVDALMKFL